MLGVGTESSSRAREERVVLDAEIFAEVSFWADNAVIDYLHTFLGLIVAGTTWLRVLGLLRAVVTRRTDPRLRIIVYAIVACLARSALEASLSTLVRHVEAIGTSDWQLGTCGAVMAARACLRRILSQSGAEVTEVTCSAGAFDDARGAVLAFRTENAVILRHHLEQGRVAELAIWTQLHCVTLLRTVAGRANFGRCVSKTWAVEALRTILAGVHARSCLVGSCSALSFSCRVRRAVVADCTNVACCSIGRMR